MDNRDNPQDETEPQDPPRRRSVIGLARQITFQDLAMLLLDGHPGGSVDNLLPALS